MNLHYTSLPSLSVSPFPTNPTFPPNTTMATRSQVPVKSAWTTDVEGDATMQTESNTTTTNVGSISSPVKPAPATTKTTVAGKPITTKTVDSHSSSASSTSTPALPSEPFQVVDMDKKWGVCSADVHASMRERENIHRTYAPDAKWLKYRRVLVDWMCEAGDEFGLHISTMHVAVMFLDRLLHKVVVARNELQLVAIACILIAAKFEEIEEVVPTLSDMNRHAQWAFSADAIQHMEFEVLRKLNWCLGTFTPLHFASYYSSKGVLFQADTMSGRALAAKVPKYMKRYIEFFADLCLQDYAFQRFSPSMMAAAIVMASRKALGIFPLWRDELNTTTNYTKNEIQLCFKAVWSCYRFNFPNAPSTGGAAEQQETSPTSVDEL